MSIIDTFSTKLGNAIGLNTNNLPRAEQGFDINTFRSQIIGDTGLLKTNLFLVSIQFSQEFAQTQTQLMKVTPRTLMMFTEQCALPGISIGSEDQSRRYGTGVAEKMPFGVFFTDITLSFLADGNGEIMKMFHNWIKYIVNYDSRRNGPTGFNEAEPYEVAYKDNYSATIEITVFNESADKIITYTLNEVYPLFLGEVGMSWADNDSIMKIPVTFTYRDWQTDSMSTANLSKGVSNNLTLLQKILKVGTAVQAISSLKKPQSVGDTINIVNNANILF
jgi:hypothetical protein